jgi:enamine deaminase RidA (YjgF/YER057c/UK114 family)
MSGTVLARLSVSGLTLPPPNPPAANYVPFTRVGAMLLIAGQTPVLNGEPQVRGVVGLSVTVVEAQAAARLCALNIRARCLRLGGFVRCLDDFTEQARVLDGASDLLVLALGENGRHARTAVGTNALPRGVPVEIDAIFSVT